MKNVCTIAPTGSVLSACMCHLTFAAHPECSIAAALQPTQVLPYTLSLHPALPLWLWMAQAQPTSRTWSNHPPQPVHNAPRLPNGILLPNYDGSHLLLYKSRLLAVLAPQRWNKRPTDITTAETLNVFCRRPRAHLFRLQIVNCRTWSSLLFWWFYVLPWFLQFLGGTFMVECTYCKSLWIKASAK